MTVTGHIINIVTGLPLCGSLTPSGTTPCQECLRLTMPPDFQDE
jgi:hypothetical protein